MRAFGGRRPAPACVLATLLTAIAFGGTAAGSALQPLDLRVDGGEEAWHPTPSFTLHWRNPAGPVAAVHYRVLDPSGGTSVAETRIGWAATAIEDLHVPFAPGAYTAEVWLEGDDGTAWASVPAKLRFDRTPPGPVKPLAPPGWIGRAALPYTLRIGRPSGTRPLSGIRGYAVSIDREAGGSPCANRHTCTESETDLRGGEGVDSIAIGDLPEGMSFAHAVAVSGSGMHSTAIGTTVLRVDRTDPVTQLEGVPSDWANLPVTLTARARDSGSGMVADGGGPPPMTALRIDGGPPVAAAGDTATATVIASGAHTIAYYARDAAGNVADGGGANGKPNGEPGVAEVRIDYGEPGIAFANAQDPRDPERIEARASDSLSGVDPAWGVISVRPAGSGEPFRRLPTAVEGGILRARWDSASYRPGEYEFRAVARDRASNEASTSSRANGKAMLLRGPLKVPTRFLVWLGGRRGAGGVPYGRSAWFGGRLVAARGAPLAGVEVRVIERFEEGAEPPERVSVVKTGAGGEFHLRLPPGPSRDVLAIAAPTPTLRGASSEALRLGVRGALRLGVSAAAAEVGGPPIVFSGRVIGEGAAVPPEGKSVELQFRLPGTPWSEFRTIRTDRRGRFRYRYRFADDDSRGARFQFRALAPAQAGWPFEPAGSRPVAVRGR
jgi:hypothetical protein